MLYSEMISAEELRDWVDKLRNGQHKVVTVEEMADMLTETFLTTPEQLETEEDYIRAPLGTAVTLMVQKPSDYMRTWIKRTSEIWDETTPGHHEFAPLWNNFTMAKCYCPRNVQRWGTT